MMVPGIMSWRIGAESTALPCQHCPSALTVLLKISLYLPGLGKTKYWAPVLPSWP